MIALYALGAAVSLFTLFLTARLLYTIGTDIARREARTALRLGVLHVVLHVKPMGVHDVRELKEYALRVAGEEAELRGVVLADALTEREIALELERGLV